MTAPLDLAHLGALLAAATPGPWTLGPAPHFHVIAVDGTPVNSAWFHYDAALIVALVNAAPALLATPPADEPGALAVNERDAIRVCRGAIARDVVEAGHLVAADIVCDALERLSGALLAEQRAHAAAVERAAELEAACPTCARIIGSDPTRHFKECPKRADFPVASTLPCGACGGSGRAAAPSPPAPVVASARERALTAAQVWALCVIADSGPQRLDRRICPSLVRRGLLIEDEGGRYLLTETGRAAERGARASQRANAVAASRPWGDNPAPIEGETLGDYRARIGAPGSDTHAAKTIRWVDGAWALAAGTVKP